MDLLDALWALSPKSPANEERECTMKFKLVESFPVAPGKIKMQDAVAKKLGLSQYSDAYVSTDLEWEKRDIKKVYGEIGFKNLPDKSCIQRYKDLLKDKLNAKYIKSRYGTIEFYFDATELAKEIEEKNQQNKLNYETNVAYYANSIPTDKFKPSDKILEKIQNYKNTFSKVNVKAIKDPAKLLTYAYAAILLDWKDLFYDVREVVRWGDEIDIDGKTYKVSDVLEAIEIKAADVRADSTKFVTTYSDLDKKFGLNTNGLFEIDPSLNNYRTWLPNKLLKHFVEKGWHVKFNGRRGGAEYDNNGAQWTEVEKLEINGENVEIAVHTNEGDAATTYSVVGQQDPRQSVAKVISVLDYLIN